MVETIPYSNRTTSKAAARSVAGTRPLLQEQVFRVISGKAGNSLGGATCDEVEKILEASHQSTSSAIRALVKAGRIIDSRTVRNTRTGRAAIVWKAATP